MSPAKAAGPTEMQFGKWTYGDNEPCVTWSPDPLPAGKSTSGGIVAHVRRMCISYANI